MVISCKRFSCSCLSSLSKVKYGGGGGGGNIKNEKERNN